MPQVMDAQAIQVGLPGRKPPDTGAEGDHQQRPTLRGGEEDQAAWSGALQAERRAV
jgi:hypothetical protein